MTKHARVVHSFTSLWEYECCGDPLAVGDEVTLSHLPFDPDLVWSPLMPIDWYVGHHDETETSRVRVKRIWEAYAALEYHPGRRGHYAGQPGTGRLVEVEAMEPHRPEWDDDFPEPPATHTPRRASGWVLEREVYE